LIAASAVAQMSPEVRAARAERTEADYQATLKALGLGALRPGADGRNRNAPNAANYQEARSGPGAPLPPLLKMASGKTAKTPLDWRKRRAEIAELLEREVYGRVPASAPRLRWDRVAVERRRKGNIPVSTSRYLGRPSNTAPQASAFAAELAVTLPATASKPVPIVIDLGFPEGFRFPGAPPQPQGQDWTEQVIERGWGYGILVPSTVQPDDGAGLREGVIGYSAAGGARKADEWGALRAWAWGASCALDLLLSDRQVDAQRVAISGLSRYGKAALIAMAFDERFSIGLIGSSGAGGAKLLRRDFGERLENLTASGEYHWFAPNFLRYGGPLTVADLPVDSHSLIALAAPRPLFIGAGNFDADGWVDPRGSFVAARAASEVYELLGMKGLVDGEYPTIGELRAGGRIAFRQHEGGHTNGPNWKAFIDFAESQWRGMQSPRRRKIPQR
jgi:hypothetical protein